MFKIDLNLPLVDIDGNPLPEETKPLSKVLTARLSMVSVEVLTPLGVSAVKAYDWAKILSKSGGLSLDTEDLEKFVKVCQALQLPLLIVGQVLDIVAEAKKSKAL